MSTSTRMTSIIISTILYSFLWFFMLFLIAGFFMPTPVAYNKRLRRKLTIKEIKKDCKEIGKQVKNIEKQSEQLDKKLKEMNKQFGEIENSYAKYGLSDDRDLDEAMFFDTIDD